MPLLCSARLQHLEKAGQLADRGTVEEQLRSAVLQPDTSLATKALVELGKATTLCMAVEAQHVLLAPNKKVRPNSSPECFNVSARDTVAYADPSYDRPRLSQGSKCAYSGLVWHVSTICVDQELT